ncbi:MAG: hypothetical protein K2N82_14265 [Lachnospiraceae bacterium]|nr:hypothetical protein [Lachnospiraceae bacterium]
MESKNNFETALYIVGKCNPYGITRLALKRGKRFNSVDELSKNELREEYTRAIDEMQKERAKERNEMLR